jgi:hypothetical protein
VITLATTKPVFVRMALAFARSFFYWNRDSGIDFHLITDLEFAVPRDLGAMKLVRTEPGALGVGFSPKLKLDSIAPAERTLFLDADCLCFGPLDGLFDRLAGRAVSVVGTTIATGQWWCDVDATRKRFNLGPLPMFNGGLYYVEPGAKASAVYSRAREFEAQYDEIGLIRLRGRPNDEILMSMAMAEHGLPPVEDDGTLFGCMNDDVVSVRKMDVLSGVCTLHNPPLPHPEHKSGRPVVELSPRVVHFLDYISDQWNYRNEELKLELAAHLPRPLARAVANCWIGLPGHAGDVARRVLRPAYRRLFGTRRVRRNLKSQI